MTFGGRLKEARKALGLEPFDFCVRVRAFGLECSEHDIWRWESDRDTPRTEACVALAKAANSTVEFLVTGEPKPSEVA